MTNNKMTATNMMRVFPQALDASQDMHALASAIADELEVLYNQNNLLGIYTRINELPESLLDILATDFRVTWYLSNGTLLSKRRQIASAFVVHRCLGTKYALVFALSDLCPGTEVQEWFEYGGDPYHFKIICDLSQQTMNVSQRDIERVTSAVKPARAVLETNSMVYRSRGTVELSDSADYVGYSTTRCGTRLCGRPLGSLI